MMGSARKSISYLRYAAWEEINDLERQGWHVVGSMGAHRDEYGVLMKLNAAANAVFTATANAEAPDE